MPSARAGGSARRGVRALLWPDGQQAAPPHNRRGSDARRPGKPAEPLRQPPRRSPPGPAPSTRARPLRTAPGTPAPARYRTPPRASPPRTRTAAAAAAGDSPDAGPSPCEGTGGGRPCRCRGGFRCGTRCRCAAWAGPACPVGAAPHYARTRHPGRGTLLPPREGDGPPPREAEPPRGDVARPPAGARPGRGRCRRAVRSPARTRGAGRGRPDVGEPLRLPRGDLLEPQRQLQRARPPSGSFARQARTSGASASGTPCSWASSCTTRYSITSELPCPKGRVAHRRVRERRTQREHVRGRRDGRRARTCSGARNPGDPTAVPTCVSVEAPVAQAMPKSMIRGPFGDSRMLDGLRSRCTTPASCTATSPSESAAPRRPPRRRRADPRRRPCRAATGRGRTAWRTRGGRPPGRRRPAGPCSRRGCAGPPRPRGRTVSGTPGPPRDRVG